MPSELVKDVVNAAVQAAPESPAVEVLAAAVNTAVSPTPESILADVELAIKLVKEIKDKLSGSHPSILSIFKALI